MSQRRYAADRESGGIPDELGIRAQDLLADLARHQVFLHPVRTTYQQQDRPSALLPLEHQRLDDLADAASAGRSRFLSRACALCHLLDLDGQSGSACRSVHQPAGARKRNAIVFH